MREGRHESKVKDFFVVVAVAANTEMMFYFTPPGPTEKTPLVFWVSATKCHLSVPRFISELCRGFPALNREFSPHVFHLPAFWKKENSLKFIQLQPLPRAGSPLCTGCSEGLNSLRVAGSLFLARKTQQKQD